MRILKFILAMLVGAFMLGCASQPKPGEAATTGGTASAVRVEDGGWAVRSLPEEKPQAPTEKWVLILQPMPEGLINPTPEKSK